MSPTLTTFLFEAANFLVLAAALGWLLFNPVRKALADRRERFDADNLLAAQKLAEAAEAQREINSTRAGLRAEMNALRTSELEAARRQADQILADARAASLREREMGQRQAAHLWDAQQKTLAEVSAAATAETVGRLLTQIGGPELRSALIESACQQLRLLSHAGISPVKIESTMPLSSQQIASIKEALGDPTATADISTLDGLGDGVRISTGNGLIDATVSGLVGFASQSLVKEMSRRSNHPHPLQISNDA